MKSPIFKIPKYQNLSPINMTEIPDLCSLIVVVKTDQINDTTSFLLNNILKSIDAEEKVVKQIIEMDGSNTYLYSEYIKSSQVKNMICFGLTPADIGLHILVKKNRVTHFEDKKLLFTYSLLAIRDEEGQGKSQLKRALWTELKGMFNLH